MRNCQAAAQAKVLAEKLRILEVRVGFRRSGSRRLLLVQLRDFPRKSKKLAGLGCCKGRK